ncbi:MAG: hypothetical protein HQ522_06530 [Bacteroidetes bacterium]|nr:hypothetical protein [Bacteroidota bacterium]
MNIDFSTKPQVTINIDPVLEAYCRFIFCTPQSQTEIAVTRHHDLGKLIHSNVITRDQRVKESLSANPVTFILPVTKINHHAVKCHFLYVSPWGEQKIQDGIEYEFKAWIRQRFEVGYNVKKWDRKTIIDTILRGLNLRNKTANFDTIKKIDYRNRRKIEESRFQELLNNCI